MEKIVQYSLLLNKSHYTRIRSRISNSSWMMDLITKDTSWWAEVA